ncbi:Asp/Glu/hydantoin racemase [Leucobacter allii]|uniref:Asp/Glu/hydantoin racemase n=1 Tax=Leucobacter allii TaxID=2932247 RepID=A0ABY4FKY4_9MICO|nr:Asp/Glu/hydantoin racemase [Leucobacter allii]UOQ56923.1 Asp/Glu/hydantoin racemase [Leucobacter allii]
MVELGELRGRPAKREALGIVAPFDLELDRELWRWLPPDVDLLMTRTPAVGTAVTVDFARELTRGAAVPEGVRSVTAGRARVVAYACTSASFVGGRAGDAAIRAAMLAAGADGAITASGAIVEALRALGAARVAVATPYLPELSALLDVYLREHGIEPVVNAALGLDREIWNVPYARTAELIRQADRPDAQAIVVSCTNLPTYALIAPLERELGKPIVTANQATMWAALARMGRRANGPGQALVDPPGYSARS